MAATCDQPMSILDGMWPPVWYGTTACEDWYRDVLTEGEHVGAFGYRVALGEPWHVNTKGDHAYVVVPATMTSNCAGSMSINPVLSLRHRFVRRLAHSVIGHGRRALNSKGRG